MHKTFEQMTIAELRKLTEQYKEQNPDIKTAQELLEEIDNDKEELKNDNVR